MVEMRAFAVLEEYESTGSIIYATSAVAARRMGANEHADGDFSAVSCRRAKWADAYVGKPLPISLMVENGWHFKCMGCGRQIDEGMCDWMEHVREGHTFRDMLAIARQYRHWTPNQIIGSQHSSVFCTQACHDEHEAHEAERKRRQLHAIEVFKRRVLKRFPDAKLIDDHGRMLPHAYATMENGRWRLRQVAVEFEFPGMKIGPAAYRWDNTSSYRKPEKPHFTCCNGDREAFEAYARSTIPGPTPPAQRGEAWNDG